MIKEERQVINLWFQAKIAFDDHAITTFEYEDEESALEKYLIDHPEEREEAMRQEDEMNGVIMEPSEPLKDSPRAPPAEPEVTMKSNTIIGSAGGTRFIKLFYVYQKQLLRLWSVLPYQI